MRCDFCNISNPDPEFTYYCDPYAVKVVGIRPDGSVDDSQPFLQNSDDWLACSECAALIETGNKEGVINRFFEVLGPTEYPPEWEEERRKDMRAFHAYFWETKKPNREMKPRGT